MLIWNSSSLQLSQLLAFGTEMPPTVHVQKNTQEWPKSEGEPVELEFEDGNLSAPWQRRYDRTGDWKG